MTESPFGDVAYASTRDGRQLRYMFADHGGDGPIVVFESAMSAAHTEWALIQPHVSQATVVYCRAGYGDSAPAPDPRTLDGMAEDLTALLDAVTESRPDHGGFILVGHSLGGLIAPRAASRTDHRIAGLVLVDPPSLAMWRGEKERRNARISRNVITAATRVGLTHLVLSLLATRKFPPAFAAESKRFEFTRGAMKAWEQEERALIAASDEPDAAATGLPDVPLVILTAGKFPKGERMAQMYRDHVAAHQALAASVTHGRQRVIADATHHMELTAPGAVVQAINEVASPHGPRSL